MHVKGLLLALSAACVAVPVAGAPAQQFSMPAVVSTVLQDLGYNLQGVSVPAPAGHGSSFSTLNDWIRFVKGQINQQFSRQVAWRKFGGWKTYKSNGVNLGAWLEIETAYAPGVIPAPYPDEWSWCGAVGFAKCGPILEAHYDTYITTADIDKLAKYGINTLRIPTTYAAWAVVPGSQLYHGRQQAKLRNIVEYAIRKYGMHIVLGLHSLPGGVNSLEIGEAFGHSGWWFNQTNFISSVFVANAALDFIKASPYSAQFTFEPINEPGDTGLQFFGSANTVSYPQGVNYLNLYMKTIYALMGLKRMKNTLMVTDAFMGASYWAPYWNKGDNIVFDSHFYYFAAQGVYATYVPGIICGQAQAAPNGVGFPIFVGEWSLATYYNNTLADRGRIYETELYAWQKYLSGGAFWNVKYLSATPISSGQGGVKDYWSYYQLIEDGIVKPGGAHLTKSYC